MYTNFEGSCVNSGVSVALVRLTLNEHIFYLFMFYIFFFLWVVVKAIFGKIGGDLLAIECLLVDLWCLAVIFYLLSVNLILLLIFNL